MNGRIYRSPRERILAGVAGGLAEQWNTDPSLVRLVWVLLVPLSGGLALLAYIAMAIIVPEAPVDSAVRVTSRPAGRPGSAQLVAGTILVLLGVWFLLEAYVPAFDAGRFWPVGLIALGIIVLAFGFRGQARELPGAPPDAPGPATDSSTDAPGSASSPSQRRVSDEP